MSLPIVEYEVVVIGAGPAGLMAAIVAGRRGKKVVLLEKNDRPGRKLLLTGQGRCNLTNLASIAQFPAQYHHGDFLRNGLHRFSNTDLIEYFEANGLRTKAEPDQRIFPCSNRAADVLAVLERQLAACRVPVFPNAAVRLVTRRDHRFATAAGEHCFHSERVVLACGGRSYPTTGSSGDGYALAASLGHTLVRPVPALCGLDVAESFTRNWEGVNLKGIGVRVHLDRALIAENNGELVFTRQGVSGPAILNISGDIAEQADRGTMRLALNFQPAFDARQMDTELRRELQGRATMQLRNLFRSFLPSGLVDDFLRAAAVDGRKTGGQITREERSRLGSRLQCFPLTIARVKGFEESMVTRGGVSTREINPKTMESTLVPGFHLAGEIIDVDGRTGGYNLQAAFTTGWCAGASV